MLSKRTDYYLKVANVYNRLLEEYMKYGKLVIACDFDDTLYDFHKKGRSYNNVIELLRRWKGKAEIIITSCIDEGDDARVQRVKDYLRDNDIPYDKINEQSSYAPTPKATKVYYNALLDDRAGLRETYDVLEKLITAIENNTISAIC